MDESLGAVSNSGTPRAHRLRSVPVRLCDGDYFEIWIEQPETKRPDPSGAA